MDLLTEAKKGNKESFNKLVESYRHIYYKLARLYFRNEYDVKIVVEKTLHYVYKNLVEAKTEYMFLTWSISVLLDQAELQQQKYEAAKYERYKTKQLAAGVNSDSKLVSHISDDEKDEYELYRSKSIVEEYITSINEDLRLPALLYYYADLEIPDISKILKVPQAKVISLIDEARTKLYEIILNKEVDI